MGALESWKKQSIVVARPEASWENLQGHDACCELPDINDRNLLTSKKDGSSAFDMYTRLATTGANR